MSETAKHRHRGDEMKRLTLVIVAVCVCGLLIWTYGIPQHDPNDTENMKTFFDASGMLVIRWQDGTMEPWQPDSMQRIVRGEVDLARLAKSYSWEPPRDMTFPALVVLDGGGDSWHIKEVRRLKDGKRLWSR